MKKIITTILLAVLCVSFAACGGGVDRQPAIDAINEASTIYNQIATFVNENPGVIPEEYVNTLADIAEVLVQNQELVVNGDVTQENLDELEAWGKNSATQLQKILDAINNAISDEDDATGGEEDVTGGENVDLYRDEAIYAVTEAATFFNNVAMFANENPGIFAQEDVDYLTSLADELVYYQDVAINGDVTQEELNDITTWGYSVYNYLTSLMGSIDDIG